METRQTSTSCRSVRKVADIVFAITACSDVFESVRFSVLLLNHLPEVFRTVVHLTRFVDSAVRHG